MRLIELRAENFQRLVAVTLKPTGAVTPITGRNGAGKTSCIDALAAALGGAKLCPEVPIRTGQTRAEVSVDLDDLVVTRVWTLKGSSLEVATKDGAAYKSPQAVLDKLVGALSFDPLAFGRMKPGDQAATLAQAAGIDLDAYRLRRGVLFTDRATANRTAKELRAQVAGMPAPPADLPAAEVPLSALLDELSAAEHVRKRREAAEREHAAAVAAHRIADQKVTDLVQQVLEAQKSLAAKLQDVHDTREALEKSPPAPDLEPIKARGRAAEETNRQVRAAQQRATKEKDAAQLEKVAGEITGKMDALDDDLALSLAAAKLPVPGLAIGGDGVTVGGIPFAQCSGAERLRVSVAIGLALNPALRLMLIRDGSLLDSDGMRLLAALAEAADAQVLIERVSDGEGVGVRIVDGSTEEAPAEDPGFPGRAIPNAA